ncbi:MAG: DUF2309 domain-containing protein [Myxococcota bacterium]
MRPDELHEALTRTVDKVAPLWPLDAFVAVNPFVGLGGVPFDEAARIMGQVAGARLTMPRHFYTEALDSGELSLSDLEAVAEAHPLAEAPPFEDQAVDGAELARLAHTEPSCTRPTPLATVADLAGAQTSTDWSSLVVQRIGAWAEGYYDGGQSIWSSPGRTLRPFEAWRAEASHDRTPELMGLHGFRTLVRALPSSAPDAVVEAVHVLGLGPSHLHTYLHRLAMTVGGWASFVRQRGWHDEAGGSRFEELRELLSIRLVWDALIYQALYGPELRQAWLSQHDRWAAAPRLPRDLEVDLRLHQAYERGAQRRLMARFPAKPRPKASDRPPVQAAFCIDVRSERLRRALECHHPGIETLGVAGFFGVPIEVLPLGHSHGAAHCPALITPSYVVEQGLPHIGEAEADTQAKRRGERGRVRGAWSWLRRAAVSSFGYVEVMGLGYGLRLVTDGLGWTRPEPDAATVDLDRSTHRHLRPDPRPGTRIAGASQRPSGIAGPARIDLAEALLTAMSLRSGFARLVVLCGHRATTVNNPHAHSLHCGACGGQSGADNARVAAELINDPAVRQELRLRGITVPADTIFVPAVHDTVTDEVQILDPERIPRSHDLDLDRLRGWLSAASQTVRAERAPTLGVTRADRVHRDLVARSRDWSQVRNEWGLAGCSYFIIAPRERSATLDLDGRSFLHSYQWRDDDRFAVLESIMTAPMVVASWINLQYYASSVDNRAFGSGNKVLHNVVGQRAVTEGNDGDIRAGLPLQSVHDGERFVHAPTRLSVVIEAPVAAIDGVLQRHASVRQLADHGWLYLLAMDDRGAIRARYAGGGQWVNIDVPNAASRSAAGHRIAS